MMRKTAPVYTELYKGTIYVSARNPVRQTVNEAQVCLAGLPWIINAVVGFIWCSDR